MNWFDLASADIKRFEGLRLQAYQDQGGVWTIGYGHTSPAIVEGLIWPETLADAVFVSDCLSAEKELEVHLDWWGEAPDQIKRGLINMCFNLGWPRLSKFSQMLTAGEEANWGLMGIEALDSVWARQVPSRAVFVSELFKSTMSGVDA